MDATTASSYLAYKKDTDVFLTWLRAAAQKCGWKPPKDKKTLELPPKAAGPAPSPSSDVVSAPVKGPGRLKGKQRKEAKQAAIERAKLLPTMINPSKTTTAESVKRTDTTTDMLNQIGVVYNAGPKKKVVMPTAVRIALQSAIRSRERYAQWYNRTNEAHTESNDTHDFFIEVLKEGLWLQEVIDEPIKNKGAPSKEMIFVDNLFEALPVHDVSVSLDENDPPRAPSVRLPATELSQKFDEQHRKKAEADFAIFSAFEDLHRIRAEVKKIWKRVGEEEVSLAEGTLLVAAAIEMARKLEDDVIQRLQSCAGSHGFEKDLTAGKTFRVLLNCIYKSKALGREEAKHDHEVKRSKYEPTPFDEFVFLPFAHGLLRFDSICEKCKKNEVAMQELIPGFANPWSLTRYDYSNKNNIKDTVEDPDNPKVQTFESEEQILLQLYYDMRFLEFLKRGEFDTAISDARFRDRMKKSVLPFFDLFHTAMQSAWTDQAVTLTSVFAARIMVDMCQACGPDVSGKELFLSQSYEFTGHLRPADGNSHTMSFRGLPVPEGIDISKFKASLCDMKRRRIDFPTWELLRKCWGESFEAILKQIKEDRKEQGASNEEDPKALGIWPSTMPTFYFEKNLLFGGTVMMDVVSMSELSGLAFANDSVSILLMAHIYNAARQTGALDTEWPEMEQVIRVQLGPIFAHDKPTTHRGFPNKLCYRAGLAEDYYGSIYSISSTRSIFSKTKDPDAPWKFRPTAPTVAMRQYIDAERSSIALLGHNIDSQAKDWEQNSKSESIASNDVASAADAVALDPIAHSFRRLEKYLAAATSDVEIDYVGLTKTCNMMLDNIKEFFDRHDIGAYTRYIPKASQRIKDLHRRVHLALTILLENATIMTVYDDLEKASKKRKVLDKYNLASHGIDLAEMASQPRPLSGDQLGYAADCIRNYVRILTEHDEASKSDELRGFREFWHLQEPSCKCGGADHWEYNLSQ